MAERFQWLLPRQHRVSRLSIAVIAAAGLAVAGLLAYTALSNDAQSVTVYGSEGAGTLELRGNVFARCEAADAGRVAEVILTVKIPQGGPPVNLSPPPNNVVQISYADPHQDIRDIPFRAEEYIAGDGDMMLETGETFLIGIPLAATLNPALGPDTPFSIAIQTPDGHGLTIQRTTPSRLDAAMNLDQE